jgi:DNA end-binding protein Ku
MATKTWKGYLQFGLLSIPVYLNVGARDESIGLNLLHKKDKGRVRMPRTCEICEQKLESADIVKGYETADGSYVLITPEELDAIEPESSRIMEIKHVVDAKSVDAIWLAESFYLLPEEPGLKPYSLLVKALADAGKVAIAQLCKSNREHVVLLRPRQNGLIAHFLYFADEVNRNPEFESLKPPVLAANELKLAAKLLESMDEPFNIAQFKDGYRERLNILIASKLDKTVKAPTPVKPLTPAVMDMMAALEASLKRPRAVALKDDDEVRTDTKKKPRKTA